MRDYLIEEHGIGSDRLETRGWGEARPVVPNADEPHRERNRRVDFTRLGAAGVKTRGLPPTGHGPLLKVSFTGCRKGSGKAWAFAKNAELKSGDMFRAEFEVLQGCHVYVLFLGSNGEVDWLRMDAPGADQLVFPTHAGNRPQYGVWCYFGDQHFLPSKSEYYVLDEIPGTEILCIVATRSPIVRPEALTAIVKYYGASLDASTLGAKTGHTNLELHMAVICHM